MLIVYNPYARGLVLEPLALNKLRSHLRVEDFEQGGFYFRRLILVWQELGSAEEVGEWLRNAVDTDEGLIKLLTAFLTIDNRLDPHWFKPFLDPASLRERINDLARAEGLSIKQRLAAVEFLQEYADRDAGNDPENDGYFSGKTTFEQMNLNKTWLIEQARIRPAA